MEPVTLIVGAITAAAAIIGSEAVKDAYQVLKARLIERESEESDIEGAIAGIEKKSQSTARQAMLQEELEGKPFQQDDPVIPLAKELLVLLNKEGRLSNGTYQASYTQKQWGDCSG